MPLLAPIAAIASAAVAATTTGLEAAGTFQPSTTAATKAAQLKSQQDQQKQAQTMEQAMFKHFAPDAQSQSGGALGEGSLSALIAELSGTQGGVSEAQQTIFGSTGGASTMPTMAGAPDQPPLPETGSGLSSTAIG